VRRTEHRLQILVAHVVVSNNITVPIRVANITRSPITIPPSTQLARLYPLVADTVVDTSDKSNVATISAVSPVVEDVESSIEDIVKSVKVDADSSASLKLRSILLEFKDLFSNCMSNLGLVSDAYHTIDTGDAPPIKNPPRHIPYHLLPYVEDEVLKLRAANIVRPSNSEWSSPIVLVRKPDGTWRLCVDYRRLNAITRRDSFPVPT
jgi:hypothetical protein